MPRNQLLLITAALIALSGCASTTTSQLIPSPQQPVCRSAAKAVILWVTRWRPDQKDVLAREAAAAQGLGQFFEKSGCFQSSTLRRLPEYSMEAIQRALADAATRHERVILIAVRELGPTVKIGASLALVEGGTEVVLDFSEYGTAEAEPRTFTVQDGKRGRTTISSSDRQFRNRGQTTFFSESQSPGKKESEAMA